MKYEIKKLTSTDIELVKQLFVLFKKVFNDSTITSEDVPNDTYLIALLLKKDFHIFTAIDEEKVVGGLTAYDLPMYSKEANEMYLYDLAVDQNYRRHGIASKLIYELKKYARENNVVTIFVEALESDIDAVDFYTSTNAEMQKVCHFNFEV